jgi:hypothetical protein
MTQCSPDSTSLVQRLRNFCVWNSRHSHYDPVPLCQEAADFIERLTAPAQAAPTREDIYACAQSTLIGFRNELTEQQIKFICDQISRKATLTEPQAAPVAWRWKWPNDRTWTLGSANPGFAADAKVTVEPLYATAPQAAPFTFSREHLIELIDRVQNRADAVELADMLWSISLSRPEQG